MIIYHGGRSGTIFPAFAPAFVSGANTAVGIAGACESVATTVEVAVEIATRIRVIAKGHRLNSVIKIMASFALERSCDRRAGSPEKKFPGLRRLEPWISLVILANVIDEEIAVDRRAAVRVSGKVPANGQVDNHEESIVGIKLPVPPPPLEKVAVFTPST